MSKALAVITAAAAGFIGGLLLAPKSGRALRQDLMNKKDEYQDKAEESLELIKGRASNIKEEVKAGAKDVKKVASE